jgi:hypothetical protein
MRWWVVSLCLVVMLSTPLVKKAEAASSLARVLDSVSPLQEGHEIPDADVDDDGEELGLRSRGRNDHLFDLKSSLCPWVSIDRLLSPILPPTPLDLSAFPPRLTQGPWLTGGSARRQAWLQHFLF